jgi:hypothetical protein
MPFPPGNMSVLLRRLQKLHVFDALFVAALQKSQPTHDPAMPLSPKRQLWRLLAPFLREMDHFFSRRRLSCPQPPPRLLSLLPSRWNAHAQIDVAVSALPNPRLCCLPHAPNRPDALLASSGQRLPTYDARHQPRQPTLYNRASRPLSSSARSHPQRLPGAANRHGP